MKYSSTNLKTIYIINFILNFQLVLSTDESDIKTKKTFLSFQHISDSCGNFSSNFFQVLSLQQNQENMITSPLSAYIILSLLFEGSEGLTKEELQSTLFSSNSKNLRKELNNLLTSLNSIENVELKMVNAVYVDNDFMLKPEFLSLSKNHFETYVEKMDTKNDVGTAKQINEWIQKSTRGKISQIIGSSDIDQYTKVILINALYFKNSWLNSFEEKFTNKKKFYNIDNSVSYVPTMSKTFQLPHSYIKSIDANFIKMKYLDENFEMIIALPNQKFGLYELERKFNWKLITEATYSTKEVELSLPKFKIEDTVNLKTTLKMLGLNLMFDKKANFSHMSEEPLFVDQILQRLFIEVDEKGSEATVATAAQMRSRRMIIDTENFMVNKPFIFAIHHKPSRIPLFIGSIRNLGIALQKDEL